jgi:hypothetical protein
MNYIEMGKLHKHPDELIEITIIKEYLLKEHDKMSAEIYRETENAEAKNIPSHLISIFNAKLEERRKLIQHLLDSAIKEYWDIKKKHNII